MPAHISFQDRLLQIKGYAALKVGNLGVGPGKYADRGYSMGDVGYFIRKMVEERQCVAPTYEMYRLLVEYWNPGRPSWTASQAPTENTAQHSRTTRMGGHRGGAALDPQFQGDHETQGSSKGVNATNTVPVSAQEWSTYLAAGCPTDKIVQGIFEKNEGIGLMLIRDGSARNSSERMKLKRIEMGKGRVWDTLWSNHDV